MINNKYILLSENSAKVNFHAGSKARYDIEKILDSLGFNIFKISFCSPASHVGVISKIINQFSFYNSWVSSLNEIDKNTIVLLQFPPINKTALFCQLLKRINNLSYKTIIVVHDIDSIRFRHDIRVLFKRFRREFVERTSLRYADLVIVHNESMAHALEEKGIVKREKMCCLGLFDYLLDEQRALPNAALRGGPVIVAGNLKPEKAGYIYSLPDDVPFRLYGPNYEMDVSGQNIEYMGSISPDELPYRLEGSFGLVWDGDSVKSCTGPFGDYLRYNNPHKLSMYIASGLPVIVWEESALAGFVRKEGVGICVGSLEDLGHILSSIDDNEYERMLCAVARLQEKVTSGEFTRMAVQACQ